MTRHWVSTETPSHTHEVATRGRGCDKLGVSEDDCGVHRAGLTYENGEGWQMLRSLELTEVGPVRELFASFGDRLNMLTGDNGREVARPCPRLTARSVNL